MLYLQICEAECSQCGGLGGHCHVQFQSTIPLLSIAVSALVHVMHSGVNPLASALFLCSYWVLLVLLHIAWHRFVLAGNLP